MRHPSEEPSSRFGPYSEHPLVRIPQANDSINDKALTIRRSFGLFGPGGLGVLAVLLALLGFQPAMAQSPGNIHYERGGLPYVTGAGAIEGRGLVVVGNNGIGEFDGGSWKLTNKLGPDDLMHYGWTSLATSGGQGWAVNELCAAMRVTPTTEEYIDIGLPCRLFDVAIGLDGTIWAAGEQRGGTERTTSLLLAHDPQDSGWKAIHSPPGEKIQAIHFDAHGTLWISVRMTIGQFAVFRWDDNLAQWEQMLLLDSLVMDFAHDPSGALWIVGGRAGVFRPSFQHIAVYRDGQFQVVFSGEGPLLRDIYFDSKGTGWAVGEWGSVLRRDIGSDEWIQAFVTGIGQYGMNTILESDDTIWFMGDIQFVKYQDGRFTYWGGEKRPWDADGITSISSPTIDSAWAAGWWGPVLHRESGIWVERYDVPHSLNSTLIMATSDQDVWVAYDRPGVIAHFDGLTWTEIAVPSEYPVIDMVSVRDHGLWVLTSARFSQETVAKGARILLFLDQKWTVAYEDPSIRMVDMSIQDGGNLWVVGDRFLMLEDGKFSEQVVPASAAEEVLVACAVVDAKSGWLASRTAVYRVRDQEILRIPVMADKDWWASLNKIVADRDSEAWVVGYGGLYHVTMTGATFIDIEAARGSQIQLNDMALLRENDHAVVWAVGRLETIVRYSSAPGVPATATPIPSAQPSATSTSLARSHLYLPLLQLR